MHACCTCMHKRLRERQSRHWMFPVLEWVCLNQHQTSTAAKRRRRALATSPHGQRTSNAEAEVSEKEFIYQTAGLNFDARQSSQLTASIWIKKNISKQNFFSWATQNTFLAYTQLPCMIVIFFSTFSSFWFSYHNVVSIARTEVSVPVY